MRRTTDPNRKTRTEAEYQKEQQRASKLHLALNALLNGEFIGLPVVMQAREFEPGEPATARYRARMTDPDGANPLLMLEWCYPGQKSAVQVYTESEVIALQSMPCGNYGVIVRAAYNRCRHKILAKRAEQNASEFVEELEKLLPCILCDRPKTTQHYCAEHAAERRQSIEISLQATEEDQTNG